MLLPENHHRILTLLTSSSRDPSKAERSKSSILPEDPIGSVHGYGREAFIFLWELD